MKENLQKYFPEISGAVLGILLALCFIGLGFFKTIFVIVMLVIGVLIGHYGPLLKNLKNK